MQKPKKKSPIKSVRKLGAWPAIESVSVKALFGKYDYAHDLHPFVNNPKGPISLLYGRNGSGKTTVLKLIYAAISPSKREGLKNYLAKTPFKELVVSLADGTEIKISKGDRLVGSFRCAIRGSTSLDVEIKTNDHGNISEQPNIDKMTQAQHSLGLHLLLLRDDRRIQTTYPFAEQKDDDVNDMYISADQMNLRPSLFLPNSKLRTTLLKDATFFVEPILSAVNEWIRDFAFIQGNTGEKDASLVYLDVIRALKRGRARAASKEDTTVESLQADLITLSKRIEPFAQFGLISGYPLSEFVAAISDAKPSSREYIAAVMVPFIASIQKRLDALTEVERVIGIFQNTLNAYLTDKRVEVDVLGGVRFHTDGGPIDPATLSSGEKQLIFLLSAALLSRVGNSIFIVDEPELSLNFEWQRTIVDSLLDITAGGNTQFIMATHSIEILSKHRSSMIELS